MCFYYRGVVTVLLVTSTDGEVPTAMSPRLPDATSRNLQSSASVKMTPTYVAETKFQTKAVDYLQPVKKSEKSAVSGRIKQSS